MVGIEELGPVGWEVVIHGFAVSWLSDSEVQPFAVEAQGSRV